MKLNILQIIYKTIDNLKIIFADYNKIGRKFISYTEQENRCNRALFECLILCFYGIDKYIIEKNKDVFIKKFASICTDNNDFRSSIDSTTKSIKSYADRFYILKDVINEVFGVKNNKFIFLDKGIK